ncbi:hypothetical protein Ddye_028327 [Dipteronia dyeriana]|uniref:Uncharacterized protein n=1 Tax=Dipteronia dyeriana TaxID=168575 RepID=A0AAD9WS81_9ROSI|nr:hypothetical protein Ddye_028327 [Dipteronia dyeriana]
MHAEVKLPCSYYEAQKITVNLGFTYKTWDACPKNCMLFINEDENLDAYDICGESGYKDIGGDSNNPQTEGKRIPAKQVRYFPLVPRLQGLFMSFKTSSFMKWHVEGCTDDSVVRHPTDGSAWKEFDKENSYFASDSSNVRLGLASDGFNPFRTMSITHSTCPQGGCIGHCDVLLLLFFRWVCLCCWLSAFGSISLTYYPNFNIPLSDQNLHNYLKIQLQVVGAPMMPNSYMATLHHQIAYKLQDHALDLPIPCHTGDTIFIKAKREDEVPTII